MHNANLLGWNGVLSSNGAGLSRILSTKGRRHGPEKACKGIATKHQSPTRPKDSHYCACWREAGFLERKIPSIRGVGKLNGAQSGGLKEKAPEQLKIAEKCFTADWIDEISAQKKPGDSGFFCCPNWACHKCAAWVTLFLLASMGQKPAAPVLFWSRCNHFCFGACHRGKGW